jgi:hypothetical protein
MRRRSPRDCPDRASIERGDPLRGRRSGRASTAMWCPSQTRSFPQPSGTRTWLPGARRRSGARHRHEVSGVPDGKQIVKDQPLKRRSVTSCFAGRARLRGRCHSGQRAHSTQRRVAGRATSRSNPIGHPHCSQAPNSSSSKSASVRRSAAASRTAWVYSALTCARSNAIVVPSGSCSSSVFDISAAATMSSNCRASDTACSPARLSSATSAERIVRRSRSVSTRIHHAYTRKGLHNSQRQSAATLLAVGEEVWPLSVRSGQAGVPLLVRRRGRWRPTKAA